MFYEVFYGFWVVGNNSCLRGVRVQISLKNNFRIFLARPEIFSGFYVSRQNFFLELFWKLANTKKISRIFFQKLLRWLLLFVNGWNFLTHLFESGIELFSPIRFWSTRWQVPPNSDIKRGGTWGEEARGARWLERDPKNADDDAGHFQQFQQFQQVSAVYQQLLKMRTLFPAAPIPTKEMIVLIILY